MRLVLSSMIALAGPAIFGLDLVVRHFVLGGQPEDLRAFLAENVTKVAWFLVPGPVIGGLLGFFAYPRVYAKAYAKTEGDHDAKHAAADLRALMVACSLPQLPALGGDLSVMLGSGLLPAVCMTSTAVVAVVVIVSFARPKAGA